MAHPKLLITSGCSFSQVPNADVTWPVHLQKYLGCEAIHCGRGAAGNSIISRTIIYNVSEALKTYKPEELLVGIMWSGHDRHNFYLSGPPADFEQFIIGNPYYANPQWITDPKRSHYYMTNSHWKDQLSIKYYRDFYDEKGSQLETLEHILRVQWFLKSMNVKYFMTKYSFDVIFMRNIKGDEDLTHVYDLIDNEHFLAVDNMDSWARQSNILYARPPDRHPSTEHHKEFVSTFIVPHLKAKNYI
jgi:hypothetical protein